MRSKPHVATVNILLAICQLKQKLNCSRAVVGIHKCDVDTCNMPLVEPVAGFEQCKRHLSAGLSQPCMWCTQSMARGFRNSGLMPSKCTTSLAVTGLQCIKPWAQFSVSPV